MNQQGNKNKPDGSQGPGQSILIILIVTMLSMFLVNTGKNMLKSRTETEVSYDTFYEMVESGEVSSVVVGDTEITITVKPDAKGYSPLIRYYTIKMEDPLRTQMLLKYGVDCSQKKPDTSGVIWDILIGVVLPFASK